MADPFTPQGHEESMTEVVARYEKRGFTGQFSSRPDGMVHCHACGAEEPAEQVPMKALHRFEGASDPSDEAALAALECPNCGGWGTLVLSYGPEGTLEDQEVLGRFLDDRAHSAIESGL